MALLLAGFASCSNDPQEQIVPDGKKAVLCTAQADPTTEGLDALAANTIDSTVRFIIDDTRVVYSGQSISLANGTYKVYMQFLFSGVWSNLHVAGATTTGDIQMGGLNATMMTVGGSGSLTMMQPGSGGAHVEGTIYINQNTAPVIEGVRFTIGDEMFENGDTIWLQKGQYVVNMEFKLNGVWSNIHTAQHTTSEGISMVSYYPPTINVSDNGSLTITQIEPGTNRVTGTIYIKAVPQTVNEKVRFTIGNQVVYSGQTVSLPKGTYAISMQFFFNGVWSNLHVAGATTTGDIQMGGLNATTMTVNGDGTVTITQPEPGTSRFTGTVYINAIN